jgi:hypothetical protein
MYNEIWRGERDFLYDPGTHGLDIEKIKKLYEPYLAVVAHRDDLNYLFREMLNQITVGHMFIAGGDQARPNAVSGGLLGASCPRLQRRKLESTASGAADRSGRECKSGGLHTCGQRPRLSGGRQHLPVF